MFEENGVPLCGAGGNGHDIARLTDVLTWAKAQTEPVLIHVITQKGKGYSYSEETPDKYHGVSKFNLEIGIVPDCKNCFSGVFGEELLTIREKGRARLCHYGRNDGRNGSSRFRRVVSPAVFLMWESPKAMALPWRQASPPRGALPVFAVYSTFLQRSYDML